MSGSNGSAPTAAPPHDRLAHLSPARREALLQKLLKDRAIVPAPGIPRRQPGERVPLSFAQARLWLAHQLQPEASTYNMLYSLRLVGAIDPDALESALGALAARHETLRTRFVAVDGEPEQVVDLPGPIALRRVDLRDRPAADREREAERIAQDEALRPYDLARGPLLRATLVRLGDAEHVLVFAMHHIVCDGLSMQVLVRETSALYAAAAAGETAHLPPLPVQYGDYAVWQRARLAGPALDDQLAWWKERLAGAPPVLDLPTDRPRAAGLSDRAGAVFLNIGPATLAALRELARRQNATLFMVMLAAWQAVLGRFSGQADVVVGTPHGGRERVELEGLIGFFANTLALRADLSGDPTFTELVGRVREMTLGAYARHDLPLERLVDALGVERSRVHTPLFQASFVIRPGGVAPVEGPDLGGVRVDPFGVGSASNPFALELSLEDADEGMAGELMYHQALWDEPTVARMMDHLGALIEAAAADPDRRLSRLVPLAGEERALVLGPWAGEAVAHDARPVHLRIAEQAARTPGAVAIEGDGERITYAAMEARADSLARRLAATGARPDTIVALAMERGPNLVIALYAVLKAGAAYLPLDPTLPPERAAFLLRDTGAILAITDGDRPDLAALVPCIDVRDVEASDAEDVASRAGLASQSAKADFVPLKRRVSNPPNVSDPPTISDALDSPVAPDTHPESLAYVVHTSGSTGEPKGVGIPHRAIANHMAWMQRAYPLAADDRVLQKTAAGFDASVWEFLAPLMAGATLVTAPPGAHRDPAELARVVAREHITVLQVVPSMVAPLLDLGPRGWGDTLRILYCGGEALPAPLAARAEAELGTRVVNLYGPTEACIDATHHPCSAADGEGTAPIGLAIDNLRAYVLDAAGELVGAGIPGELHLGGEGLARGYLGRPAQTAERFVPDPFSGTPGARLYRTGDRVRRRGDGVLLYHGRLDGQVKIRGVRIEPGEVEAALRHHPAVRDAAVAARDDGTGPRLVAWIVPSGDAPRADELRDHLRDYLPEALVPAACVTVDAFPRTPGGKVDRAALPAPSVDGEGRVAPRTEMEARVAAVWAEVLGMEPGALGVHDSFFERGGHSFLAAQAAARLEKALGVEMPLAAFLESPTVAGQARRVEAAVGHPGASGIAFAPAGRGPLVALQPAGDRPPLYLVHPTGGGVACYLELARRLAAGGQPLLALQSRGFGAGEAVHDTIEAMAADYVDALLTARPGGPWRIGGWSMGSVVAFEMASQLRARGETVDALVLIDSDVPPTPWMDETQTLVAFAWTLAAAAGAGERPAMRGFDPAGGIAALFDAARADGLVPAAFDADAFGRLYGVFRANSLALSRYRPRPYAGRITLLRAGAAGDGGWDALASEAKVRAIPGDHFSLLREPHVAVLAAILTA